MDGKHVISNTDLGKFSHGNFDFVYDPAGPAITAVVRVKYDFEPGIGLEDQKTFKNKMQEAVDEHWNSQAYLVPKDISKNVASARIPIRVVLKEDAESHHFTVDVETNRTWPFERPWVGWDLNVGASIDGKPITVPTLAHELGHVLGNWDEYDGGFLYNRGYWQDGRFVYEADRTLMGSGTEQRERYFDHFAEAASKLLGKEYIPKLTSTIPQSAEGLSLEAENTGGPSRLGSKTPDQSALSEIPDLSGNNERSIAPRAPLSAAEDGPVSKTGSRSSKDVCIAGLWDAGNKLDSDSGRQDPRTAPWLELSDGGRYLQDLLGDGSPHGSVPNLDASISPWLGLSEGGRYLQDLLHEGGARDLGDDGPTCQPLPHHDGGHLENYWDQGGVPDADLTPDGEGLPDLSLSDGELLASLDLEQVADDDSLADYHTLAAGEGPADTPWTDLAAFSQLGAPGGDWTSLGPGGADWLDAYDGGFDMLDGYDGWCDSGVALVASPDVCDYGLA